MLLTGIMLVSCGSLQEGSEVNPLGGPISGIKGYGEGTQVKLLHAKVISTGSLSFEIRGWIEVAKAETDRQLAVHYVAPGVSGDEGWYDVEAEYLCDAEDSSREVWSFVIEGMDSSLDPNGYARFAVRYTVDGVEYWDNNGGYDYWLSFEDQIAFGKSTVALDFAYYTVGPSYNPYPPQFTGYVYVKDLSFEKQVTIHYTTNNWADVLQLSGNYQSEEGLDGELWWFSVVLPAKTDNIQFAVNYTWAEGTSWDNNLGENFSINGSQTIR